ncbi:MAG TPA: DUF6600 domain-containing protein [Blastocatellia bacterium]|nr:DUF6600 domain-containing protein [Blastocatellia bacterium]
MKRKYICIILLLVIFGSLSCVSRASFRYRPVPRQSLVVDTGVFYDELAPYGRWFRLDPYGWVWTPAGVSFGWRPYTHGHWVWTDYGWTWVSRWRWGWAPFHYGRWFHHSHHGWVWVPGTVWGPAWVVWRHQPGWIGWAPMPPQVEWRSGIGFNLSYGEMDNLIEPFAYTFVEERYLPEGTLDQHLELAARNVTLLRGTRNVTNYESIENRVINRSVNVERIENATGRKVTQHRIVDTNPAGVMNGEMVRGNEVITYRPAVTAVRPERAPRSVEPERGRPPADITRREETERRHLEQEQRRAQTDLERLHRREQQRSAGRPASDELRNQQERERRALNEQRQREQQVLRGRQETRRKVEPSPEGRSRPEPARKPAGRKP